MIDGRVEEQLAKLEGRISKIEEQLPTVDEGFVQETLGSAIERIATTFGVPKVAASKLTWAILTFIAILGARKQLSPHDLISFDTLLIYWLPIVSLIFFLSAFINKFKRVKYIIKRVFQSKADRVTDDIKNNRLSLDDINIHLSTTKFTSDQLKEIMTHFHDSGLFNLSSIQLSLITNSKNVIFNAGFLPYLENSLITDQWDSRAVIQFLNKMEYELENDYLKKLCGHYKQYPSVLFKIGQKQKYMPDGPTATREQKIISMGSNFKKYSKWSRHYRLAAIFLLLISVMALLYYGLRFAFIDEAIYKSVSGDIAKNMILHDVLYFYYVGLFLSVLFLFTQSKLGTSFSKHLFEMDIRNVLEKEGIKSSFVSESEIDCFISDLIAD